jgi:hypothetical protein
MPRDPALPPEQRSAAKPETQPPREKTQHREETGTASSPPLSLLFSSLPSLPPLSLLLSSTNQRMICKNRVLPGLTAGLAERLEPTRQDTIAGRLISILFQCDRV